MNYSIIRYMLGQVTFLTGVCLLLPSLVAVIYQENTGFSYFVCAIFSMILGKLMAHKKYSNSTFYAREGFLVVSLSWVMISLIGAAPLYISGEFPSYTNALFEIISGFTTTGASVATDVEALSHAALFWRSFSHWIGGMGVLVFLLALLPMTGGQSLYFMKAESPGPSVGKQLPRMQTTAKYLYTIYFALTVIMFMFLIVGDMNAFDAVCTSFGTAGTGGFANYADGLAGFSTYTQIVVTVFMMLFGVNFNFYFFIVFRKFKEAFKLEEVWWYFAIYFTAILAMAINLTKIGGSFTYNLLHSAFQGASIMTTTGFSTVDFNYWPGFSKSILVLLMFIGACAGSTGGGIKVSRILIYLKSVRKELQHLIHPKNIKILKLENKPIDHDVLRSANVFLIAYVAIFTLSILLVSLDGYDACTTITAVAATFNNIGPGLNLVGPLGNFDCLSTLSKYVLMFDMLAGRLEIFPMLLLFTPTAWKRKN